MELHSIGVLTESLLSLLLYIFLPITASKYFMEYVDYLLVNYFNLSSGLL
jgi:hypothetical protein